MVLLEFRADVLNVQEDTFAPLEDGLDNGLFIAPGKLRSEFLAEIAAYVFPVLLSAGIKYQRTKPGLGAGSVPRVPDGW